MISPRTAAELIHELGISAPEDIRIEAIAQYCGATVVYEPLRGAEARILGKGDHAIITVNEAASEGPQRFSAAHELGHWMADRGRIAKVCSEQELHSGWDPLEREQRANRFAADLLLPKGLFAPLAKGRPIVFETVRSLAETFHTSETATAIRLVEEGHLPAMVVCSSASGRKWFSRSPILPANAWPTKRPGAASIAARLLKGAVGDSGPDEVDADAWIDHPDARDYVLVEDSIRVAGMVLSLLWWRDESQVLALDREYEQESDAEDESAEDESAEPRWPR